MAIKLIKASKILRTGMYDLVAYCKRTGIPIKEDPNFRIEDQDYLKISKELNPYIASLIESKRTSAQKFTLSNSAQHRSSAKGKSEVAWSKEDVTLLGNFTHAEYSLVK